MKAFGLFGAASTVPYRSTNGITFDLRGGDVVQPLAWNAANPDGTSAWFTAPYFRRWLSFYCPLPLLPWLSVRIGRFGVYCGSKCFGVDSEAYKNWFAKDAPESVYVGSRALMLFSMRFTGTLGKQ